MLTFIKHNLILENPDLFKANRHQHAEPIEDETIEETDYESDEDDVKFEDS
jgi:hypothetical protein